MSLKAQGQVRRSQVITTYGPGALIDLPRHSAIVGGLRWWPHTNDLEEIIEPRLTSKLGVMTNVPSPRLYAPPPANERWEKPKGITAWRFPEWFVVQEKVRTDEKGRSRRLVHRKNLDPTSGRFEGRPVVATRFVRACPRGHVDDINWHAYVHGPASDCPRTRQLWLDERGTSGDLVDLWVRCECKKTRPMFEAQMQEQNPLGTCSGERPWLGSHAHEDCTQISRLLIRTATNAYFPQVVSVLSLPDRGNDVETAVREIWDYLEIVEDLGDLKLLKKKVRVTNKIGHFADKEVLEAIERIRSGKGSERPVKEVELDAIVAAEEGYGDDVPVDPKFHARRLPDTAWRRSKRFDGVEAVVQLHRLREVMALVGFSRLDAVTPDINGEYESDVERAQIAQEPEWFPATENRGEGVFLKLGTDAVAAWLARPEVGKRAKALEAGHEQWRKRRGGRAARRPFPGAPYVLLHTLSHLLIQSFSMRCGYPASSIRERVYADEKNKRYGLLLYTGTPDAEGTLGGLVQQARHMDDHLAYALNMSALCSSDPICSQHSPDESLEKRWLHGAACHGCTLVPETCCEMRNDYLDRALVIPVLGMPGAAFFGITA